jgi:hypothetical protein
MIFIMVVVTACLLLIVGTVCRPDTTEKSIINISKVLQRHNDALVAQANQIKLLQLTTKPAKK